MSSAMRLAFALAPLLACLPALAQADHKSSSGSARASVTLIDGWRQEDGTRIAAVEIELAPGWHTYWRVPGEAGVPPEFDWSASENLRSVSYEWPRPEVFMSNGIRSYGYAERLVLPIRLTPEDPTRPMDIALSLTFGMCYDICMSENEQLSAVLLPDSADIGRARIEAALAERALSASEAGVTDASCTLVPAADGKGVEIAAAVTFAGALPPGQLAVIEPGQPDLWIGDPESATDGRTVAARAPVEAGGGGGPVLDRGALRVTVLDGKRAVDIRGCGGGS